MPGLFSIELFARIAERGSFTKAADELETSRTRASRLIKELEEELGVQLLVRTTRKVQLTEAGLSYFEGVNVALDQLRQASDEASEHGTRVTGRLRVSVPMSFGVKHLAPIVKEYRQRFPNVIIDTQLTDRRVDLVEEGFDVALRIGHLPDSTLKARRLIEVPRLISASPDYIATAGPLIKPQDLSHHDCLSFTLLSERTDWRLTNPDGEVVTVSVSGGMTANNGDILVEAAAMGCGIVNMPEFLVAPYLADGRLIRLLDPWAPPSAALHAIWPDGRMPLKLRMFLDLLVETFSVRD